MHHRRMLAIIAALPMVAAVGCGEQTQAEKEAVKACPGVAQAFEGKCATKESAEQNAHAEQVEHEKSEIEGVVKKRAAEETASQLEGR